MNKWEYHTLKAPTGPMSHLQDDLSVVGRHGWELVGILENNILIFKRPALEPSPNYPEFPRGHKTW